LALGIERPDELSTEELTHRIESASTVADAAQGASAGRGWFDVARHLVAQVVEQGLNLPGAARVLRTVGSTWLSSGGRARPPLPTVTLAQIYLAQGHDERARAILAQVLERQPDHPKARQLLFEIEQRTASAPPNATADEPVRGADDPNLARASAPEPPLPSRAAGADVLVALLGDGSARLCWQLGPVGEQLVADQGVEILVRVVRARSLGPVVNEVRHPVSTASGVRSVALPRGAALCAALCDVHGNAGVLGVASVFEADGRAHLGFAPSLVLEPEVRQLAEQFRATS
jgi:hypothetical protein